MTILINDVAMTDPGDAPYVPDLKRNLFLNFNAALDAPGNGAQISSITMRGNAPLTKDKTFGTLRGTGTHKPVSVGGSPAYLAFDGTATLANSNVNTDTTLLSNQFTVAMRIRMKNWLAATANSGLLRGVVSRPAAIRPNGTDGVLEVAGGSSTVSWTAVNTGIAANQWAVVIVVWDDVASDKILAGTGDVQTINIAAGASIQGMGFGANISTTGDATNFDMSHYAVWNRALLNEEMLAVRDAWNALLDIG